jgi:hypothetical protein
MLSSRMNRLPKGTLLVLFAVMALAALACPRGASAVNRVSVGLQIDVGDYDYLGGYGEWLQEPGFGTVWHPYVVADWGPFENGHWIWSDNGWAWVSYEPFGWLVYHYGYWYRDPRIGWFWLPGRIWSPACVEWYTFGDYCAWAPLPPPGYSWHDPWYGHGFNVWFVVGVNHFADNEVWRHREGRFPGRDIYSRGAIVKRSPPIRQIETVMKRQFTPVRISRERVDLRQEQATAPTRYSRPRAPERTRMVLPQPEVDRVKEQQQRVKREVLVPPERATRHEAQQAPRPEVQRPQQRPVERGRKSVRRR